MADSSSSGKSQLAQAAASRPARASRGKKSLVHASVFSVRDLLSEFGKALPNMLHLDASNYPSKYDQSKVDVIARLFGINGPYRAVIHAPNDRACYPNPGAIRIYKETFYARLRLPPPDFVYRLLAEARVCPTQLHRALYLLFHGSVSQTQS